MTTSSNGFEHFITRSGDRLMDGEKEFRFISFNTPTILMNDDAWEGEKYNVRYPTRYEQEDALKSVVQMGGNSIRTYVLTVRRAVDDPGVPRFIEGPGQFNEEAFQCLDTMLELANRHRIRVVIPFVCIFIWCGGVADYSVFRGKGEVFIRMDQEGIDYFHRKIPDDPFWTDRQIIDDFKSTIRYVLNRVNTRTGIRYKDDKAILAWETGNELRAPDAWTAEISAYIKSIDSNHLVMDGAYGISQASLDNPDIDIVSNHYYGWSSYGNDYAAPCRKDKELTRGKKVFIVGEFGIAPTPDLEKMLDEVIENGTSGAYIWSLRYHSEDGGFYRHSEYPMGGVMYESYHWPGFAEGSHYDEINALRLMRNKAYEIQGLPVPPLEVPESPVLLPTSTPLKLNWLGSAGAASYDVERAEGIDGPWYCIRRYLSDAKQVTELQPLYADTVALKGVDYYYRVFARNDSGVSEASNIIGPVALK